MFLQHLDTELVEEDVQKITSGSKAKAQIMVLTAQIMIIFFICLGVFSNLLLSLDYLCVFPHLVAKIGHFTLLPSPGEVWIHRPTKRHKPSTFPQTSGDSLEGSEPDL